MKRRHFFRQFLGALGIAATGASAGNASEKVLIQSSPIAGFQFHQGEAVWDSLSIGSRLELQREAENPHDRNAVAVYFQQDKLGYIPAAENTALAQMLDRGKSLNATVSELKKSDDPCHRIQVTISLA